MLALIPGLAFTVTGEVDPLTVRIRLVGGDTDTTGVFTDRLTYSTCAQKVELELA